MVTALVMAVHVVKAHVVFVCMFILHIMTVRAMVVHDDFI